METHWPPRGISPYLHIYCCMSWMICGYRQRCTQSCHPNTGLEIQVGNVWKWQVPPLQFWAASFWCSARSQSLTTTTSSVLRIFLIFVLQFPTLEIMHLCISSTSRICPFCVFFLLSGIATGTFTDRCAVGHSYLFFFCVTQAEPFLCSLLTVICLTMPNHHSLISGGLIAEMIINMTEE